MSDKDSQEQSLIASGRQYEQVTCPFSNGNWKKAGDALVFIMLSVTAVLVLIALLMNGLL